MEEHGKLGHRPLPVEQPLGAPHELSLGQDIPPLLPKARSVDPGVHHAVGCGGVILSVVAVEPVVVFAVPVPNSSVGTRVHHCPGRKRRHHRRNARFIVRGHKDPAGLW